tara:strand:+ start:1527 stop:1658 length:132 start_codon:yes stop_codon:yes gene_type:complete
MIGPLLIMGLICAAISTLLKNNSSPITIEKDEDLEEDTKKRLP